MSLRLFIYFTTFKIYGSDKLMALGNILGGFIVVLVGATLMPTIADQTEATYNAGNSVNASATNVTGAAKAITGLVPLFFALGIMATGVALAVNGLRESGMM